MHQYLASLLCFSISFSMTVAGHYFPWKYVIWRELTCKEAFVYGLGCIVALPSLTLLLLNKWDVLLLLVGSCAATGVVLLLMGNFNVTAKRQMPRSEIYFYGTAATLFVPLAGTIYFKEWPMFAMLLFSLFGAAIATIGTKAFDNFIALRHQTMDLQDKLNYADARRISEVD